MNVLHEYHDVFRWIDEQHGAMLDQVISWSNINSYTFNLLGLKTLSQKLKEALEVFDEDVRNVDLPVYTYIDASGEAREFEPVPALMVCKRPSAPKQGLFVIHMDTFYPPQDSLQEVFLIEGRYLRGPGVTDAKGGIAVLLKSLEAFEQTDVARRIGWKIVIIPDGGAGESGSDGMLKAAAQSADRGFVFEPCLPSGDLVGARKGCGYFTLVAHSRPTSRTKPYGVDDQPSPGAIDAIASCISRLNALNDARPDVSVRIGMVQGGQAAHLVPEVATLWFDVRIKNLEDRFYVEEQIRAIVEETARAKGVRLSLHGGFSVPPKPLEVETLMLYHQVRDCASELGLNLQWQESSEVCSGNRLQAAGLPTVDSLGVRGGHIHRPEEFLVIDSLKERAKLTTLFLLKWAHGL